jgi:hypothetical protein
MIRPRPIPTIVLPGAAAAAYAAVAFREARRPRKGLSPLVIELRWVIPDFLPVFADTGRLGRKVLP